MQNKAIEKINAELGNNPDGYLVWIANFLKKINTSGSISEKILDPKKSIQNCFEELKKVASSKQKNCCYYMADDEKEELIKKYYDIEDIVKTTERAIENKDSGIINLYDLID